MYTAQQMQRDSTKLEKVFRTNNTHWGIVQKKHIQFLKTVIESTYCICIGIDWFIGVFQEKRIILNYGFKSFIATIQMLGGK